MARQELVHLWHAAVAAVKGDRAVRDSLKTAPINPVDGIIAVGKAAGAMASAARPVWPGASCMVVTKYGHPGADGAEVIEAAHPVPDTSSLRAGKALRARVASFDTDAHVLMLVSGGASSLAEDLIDGWDLDRLTRETTRLLASGADIHAMNARRKALSRIKGGGLLGGFGGSRVTVLAISDVEGDDINVIGSGIGQVPDSAPFKSEVRIVASNAVARAAVAAGRNDVATNSETLYGDVGDVARRIGATLKAGPSGLYIFGGEPTVVLPDAPGKGGRNMALALLLSKEIAGSDMAALIAGTDGTDGPTDAAGAFADGSLWQPGAADALGRADAYPWLDGAGALFRSGPTGTNVMDLAIAIKP